MNRSELPTIEEETTLQENSGEGSASEESLYDIFASAETGMPTIPDEIEVTSLEDVLNATHLSPEALEQFRVSYSGE